jgi:hypothetical protein
MNSSNPRRKANLKGNGVKMLYGVTVSENDAKVFQKKLGTTGKIVHRSRHFVVFASDFEWGYLRSQFPDNIISTFNQDCELGKEIMQSMKKEKTPDE